jgi:hypothetical protein
MALSDNDISLPNLDGLDDAELYELREMLPTYHQVVDNMVLARKRRKQGRISEAMKLEARNDPLIEELPEWARW